MAIQVIDKDEHTKFFAFTGKVATLPEEPALFTDAGDAQKKGYIVANILLESDQIGSVKAFQTQGTDCLEITLGKNMKWKPVFEKAIVLKLTNDFVAKRVPLYKHPNSKFIPDNLVEQLNEFIQTSNAPVFETIRNDGGIEAVGWTNVPEIQAHFVMTGKCAGSCVKGDTNPTQSSVKTAVRSRFPYISDFVFMEDPNPAL